MQVCLIHSQLSNSPKSQVNLKSVLLKEAFPPSAAFTQEITGPVSNLISSIMPLRGNVEKRVDSWIRRQEDITTSPVASGTCCLLDPGQITLPLNVTLEDIKIKVCMGVHWKHEFPKRSSPCLWNAMHEPLQKRGREWKGWEWKEEQSVEGGGGARGKNERRMHGIVCIFLSICLWLSLRGGGEEGRQLGTYHPTKYSLIFFFKKEQAFT